MDLLAASTLDAFGRVDILVNNAGVWGLGACESPDLDQWRRMLDVNVMGVVHGLRSFLPILLDASSGGRIVNVASTAGVTGGPFRGAYTASKHAVVGLSRSLRAEMRARRSDVAISLVCPGKVETDIFRATQDVIEQPDNALSDDARRSFAAIREVPAIEAAEAARYIVDRVWAGAFWIFPGAAAAARAIERESKQLLDAVRAM